MAGEQRPLSGRVPRGFGAEGSGAIIAVGPGCRHFSVSDRVAFMTNPLSRNGVFSGLVDIPTSMAVKLPDTLDLKLAAALPVASITAGRALGKKAKLLLSCAKPEQNRKVLVIGASGGVGSLLTQYLVRLGFHPDLSGSPERLSACGFYESSAGIGSLIDRKLTPAGSDGKRWDLVFDCHGDLWDAKKIRTLLSERGELVNVSLANDKILKAVLLPLSGIHNRIVLALPHRNLLACGLQLAASGAVVPCIGAVYPWQEASDAIASQRCGKHFGKVLVDLRDLPLQLG